MNPLRCGLSLLFCAMLSACVASYQAPPGQTAKLKITSMGDAWVCVGGEMRPLKPDTSGLATIQAGRRLTIGASFTTRIYKGASASCAPSVSIIPQTGKTYYQDLETEAESCTAFIYEMVNTNRAGLAFDATLNPRSTCAN